MTTAQYADYLNEVDTALTHWISDYQKLDVAKIDISYASGKEAMQFRDLELNQLSLLRKFIGEEKIKPRLWRQISIATSIQGVADSYSSILFMLPQDRVLPEWDATYLRMAPEVCFKRACKLFILFGVPDGIRTRVIAVKGRCPR